MGNCWHVVIPLPKRGEKLHLQTTVKTQKPLLFGTDCQHHLTLMPMVSAYLLSLYPIQFCEARDRPKNTMPKSLSFSTFCPPVEYFQRLGCVLGPASAALCSALEGMLMSTAGVSYRHLGWETGAEHQCASVCAGGNPEEEKLQPQQPA